MTPEPKELLAAAADKVNPELEAQESEFLSVLNAKIDQTLEQATSQCIQYHDHANGVKRRLSQEVVAIIGQLRDLHWNFPWITEEEEKEIGYDHIQDISEKERGFRGYIPLTSAHEAVAILKGLRIVKRGERKISHIAFREDELPTWEDVLNIEDGFSVEAYPPGDGDEIWRGLVRKSGNSFSLDFRLYNHRWGKKENLLKSFTYTPQYSLGPTGFLEYSEYTGSDRLRGIRIPISAIKPPTETKKE